MLLASVTIDGGTSAASVTGCFAPNRLQLLTSTWDDSAPATLTRLGAPIGAPQLGPSGNGDANNRHLIFAKDSENVTLCGPGTVNGQGPSFWVPSGRRKYPPEERRRCIFPLAQRQNRTDERGHDWTRPAIHVDTDIWYGSQPPPSLRTLYEHLWQGFIRPCRL